MKDKLYYVIDTEQQSIEYVIEQPGDEDVLVMRRSDSESWSEHARGEEIMKVFGTGNGYHIKWAEKPGKVLDYSQIAELTVMLNFINKFDSNSPLKYHVVDTNNMVETV